MSEKICRLCLGQAVVSYSLLDENGMEMLEALINIKVTEQEKNATTACIKCWLNLKLAYNIQQEVEEDNTHIKKEVQGYENNEEDFVSSILNEEEIIEDDQNSLFESVENGVILIKGEFTDEPELFENIIEEEEEQDDENEELEQGNGENEEEAPEENSENPTITKIITGGTQFTCVICGDNLTEDSIESHVRKHFLNPQHCDECDKTFPNLNSYKAHIVSDHDSKFETYNCSNCNASFQYKSLYNLHVKKAHNTDLRQRFALKMVRPKKTSETDTFEDESTNGIYTCPVCNKTFNEQEKKRFEVHVKVHQRKECPVCHAMITVSNLKKHVSAHSATPSVCHLCGATCKNYDSLRGHLYYTHSTNSFPCEHCGKIFKKSYAKRLHVKKEHTGEKNHICDTCGKGFFTHYCLNKHIRMTHMKLRPHVCEHCNKGFSSKFALRTHVRQHTNDAPYKCDICGEGFRQNVSLRVHKKNKHDIVEVKNCECKVCGKMFVSKWAVLSHMRLH
ncbi:unnamed protein product [Brassicogethes aeneus]|uniref:Uncharacterized protein n=1 Tax=Brassicogethes aeneus TaxID=1431903 RepID=A0A9P0BDT3_BRAAE|nr:unnamed protein product [Brassicogethes aeneus]